MHLRYSTLYRDANAGFYVRGAPILETKSKRYSLDPGQCLVGQNPYKHFRISY